MPTICTFIRDRLVTRNDGAYFDAEIEVENAEEHHGLIAVLVGHSGSKLTNSAGEHTSEILAPLRKTDHSLWQLNPGLREDLLNRVRCMTLVRG